MRNLRFALVLILATLSIPALALEGPTYKYVEGGYAEVDTSGSSSDDGWFGGGSFGGKMWQVFAEYDDFDAGSLTFVGAGWHGLLGDRADIVAQLSYVEVDPSGGSSENGYRATAGVRGQILPFLEIAGYVHHTDVEDSDDAFEARVVGYFGQLGIGASFENNDIDITKVFLRWTFGQ